MLELTASAANKIGELLSDQAGKAVRISISSGGCNGFKKEFSIDSISTDDLVVSIGNATVIIDPISSDIIGHAVIDWVTNFSGSFFDIKVPAATSSCGCGESFSL